MSDAVFFRILDTPVDAKGSILASQVRSLNISNPTRDVYTVSCVEFAAIPGSPFAYWVSQQLRGIHVSSPMLQSYGISVQHGLSTKHDARWLRLSWEVPIAAVNARWFPFAKGGAFSRYYLDLHLLVDAEDSFAALEEELLGKYPYLGDNASWVLHPENDYLAPGLTYTRRTTSPFSVRPLPAGAYFSDKGPGCIGEASELPWVLALLNSPAFRYLLGLRMGAADAAARSYEVGIVATIPLPQVDRDAREFLGKRARMAHDLVRGAHTSDGMSHGFCLPGLVQHRRSSLLETSLALKAEAQAALARLAAIQAEIDDLVFDLYGLCEADRALVRAEVGDEQQAAGSEQQDTLLAPRITDDERDEKLTPPEDLPGQAQNLLMWCVGAAFGRWDVRMALDPTLLPALQGPFDPLPRCAPGALVSADGLPTATAEDIAPEAWLRTRQNVLDLPPSPFQGEGPGERMDYPLPIAWDGILVDDPGHPSDIVARVRNVLVLLWGERAAAIEREACDILGAKTLRDYFRDPRRGFFSFHIKRHSKSRRKSPIYWLLQSDRRNYGIWLYIHRLDDATLHRAAREYADAKVALEEGRLAELREGLEALGGSARRRREREIDQQQKLVAEVTEFRDRLDAVARLNLPPDLNDGVVIGIAPLHELVPWKEARKTWEKLVAGEYEWSTMAQRMRARGLMMPET